MTTTGGGAVQWWHERIEQHYKTMLGRLEADETLAVEALLADGSRLAVTSFSYHGPDMVILEGHDAHGQPAMLCAQLGSVQVLFTIMKKPAAGTPPKARARA